LLAVVLKAWGGNYPTLALPLTGEGTFRSSPCEGGGREGVIAAQIPQSNSIQLA